ncbi:unnamed protein product [Mytilus edulis]|uniref:Uncharacterized protein n=1 Tax=Mytilus edulis TaxID=6550 RepID=A0A8S3QX55_MYTED|nr:unnamed protein product [Mytilus edulis]
MLLEYGRVEDRIIQHDSSLPTCRDAALKCRFAESVKHEGLRKELRRLNIDSPTLKFLDLSDTADHWIERQDKKSTINQEKAKAKTEEQTNTELPFDMNETIYCLKNVKSHRQLKSRCSQLIKDLGTLESNPLMVNIMDQRMEVDAKAMDNYPDDIPDTRAIYPCNVLMIRFLMSFIRIENTVNENNERLRRLVNKNKSNYGDTDLEDLIPSADLGGP